MNEALIAQVFDRLGSVDTKVTLLVKAEEERAAAHTALSKRITSLEHSRTRQKGMVAIVSASIAAIGVVLGYLFK